MDTQNTYWFLFHKDRLLLKKGESGLACLPCSPDSPFKTQDLNHELGSCQGIRCVAAQVESSPPEADWVALTLGDAADIIGRELFLIAGKGRELIHWDLQSRYCGHCGVRTRLHTPISKRCPDCGTDIFPRISLAVLVLVEKGDSALLVRAHNFKGPFYGLVSGFLEAGESLEECVTREVMEETALSVGDVRYFGSQTWPFPSSLMVGFIASYVSGEIKLQEDELLEAGFFTREELRELPKPSRISLTRQMMEWWAAK